MLKNLYRKSLVDKRVLVSFSIVSAFLAADTMIMYVSDLIVPYLVSLWSIIFFIVIAAAFGFGVFFILGLVGRSTKTIRVKDRSMQYIHKIVQINQYFLVAIILAVVLEISFFSQYHTDLLAASTGLSQVLTEAILVIFAIRFFLWFKNNTSSITVVLYGLSFALTAMWLAIGTAQDLYLITEKDSITNSKSEVKFAYDLIEPGSILDILTTLYAYIDLASFILLIAATAFLLRHYMNKIGRIKFWIIIALPLLYYVSTSLELLGLYTPVTDTEWFYWWLYVSLNATAGGILFGLSFWMIAKTIREDSPVKQYMIIAAYGFVLAFISNQTTLVGASYPPFGISTLSFLSLATYMIFLGVNSTAISISQDNQLRKSIKKLATENSNLLGSIGTAQMEYEIRKTVNSMKSVVEEQEKELEEQTGIETNLGEDEMKNYLEEVMQEVGKAKKPST
jgi:hypothetical protein